MINDAVSHWIRCSGLLADMLVLWVVFYVLLISGYAFKAGPLALSLRVFIVVVGFFM